MVFNFIVANKNANKEYAYFSDIKLSLGQVVKVNFGKIKKEFWAVCSSELSANENSNENSN